MNVIRGHERSLPTCPISWSRFLSRRNAIVGQGSCGSAKLFLHVFRPMGLRLQLLYIICEEMGLFRKKKFLVLGQSVQLFSQILHQLLVRISDLGRGCRQNGERKIRLQITFQTGLQGPPVGHQLVSTSMGSGEVDDLSAKLDKFLGAEVFFPCLSQNT